MPIEKIDDALDAVDQELDDKLQEDAVVTDDDDVEVVVVDDEPVKPGGKDEVVKTDDDHVDAPGDKTDDDDVQDDTGDLDEEALSYSKAVQKRIQREQRISRQARAAVESEREERIKAQRELHKRNKDIVEVLSVSVERDIKEKVAALKVAREGEDVGKAVDLEQELDDLRAKKRDIETAKANLEKEPDFGVRARPNELADGWKSRNRWFTHPRFKAETVFAMTIDKRLAAEGMNPMTPEYFREFDRRIAEELPDLRARVKTVFKPAVKPQAKQTVAAVQPKGAAVSPAGKTRMTLTKSDLEAMQNFKMDPTNPAHLKQYAREKMEAANG